MRRRKRGEGKERLIGSPKAKGSIGFESSLSIVVRERNEDEDESELVGGVGWSGAFRRRKGQEKLIELYDDCRLRNCEEEMESLDQYAGGSRKDGESNDPKRRDLGVRGIRSEV